MKASELIKLVQAEIDSHGDEEIRFEEGINKARFGFSMPAALDNRTVYYQPEHSQTWHDKSVTTYPPAIVIEV